MAKLRFGMQEQFTKLDARVINIETNMATKIELAILRTEMHSWKNELTWRLIGLGIAFSGIIITGFFAALQTYLP